MKTQILFLSALVSIELSGIAQATWTPKASIPATATKRVQAAGFSIGLKGYIGTGRDVSNTALKDFWQWEQASNVWTQKADFGGGLRSAAVGFSIGNKGYIGTGSNTNEFWEYDPAANNWTKKANFGGAGRGSAVGFSIGTKGYIGTGSTNMMGPGAIDFWEYNQSADNWTQKANLGVVPRRGAVGFSIGAKGYIGTGYANYTASNDFWEWDQATNTWTQKANFPGTGRFYAVGFSIGNKGYIGTGQDKAGVPYKDFWQWDQATNTWTQGPDYGGGTVMGAVGFSIGNYGYIGSGGYDSTTTSGHIKNYSNDFWEYTPDTTTGCIAAAVISSDPSAATTLCVGQNAYITASGGVSYLWNTGSASAFIVASPTVTTTYSVTVTDASGCTGTAAVTFIVDPNCSATGMAQFNADALQAEVWPNPSNGKINLKINPFENLKIESIEIYNVFGEKIYPAVDFQINQSSPQGVLGTNFQIDLSAHSDGVYFLKLKTGGAIINEKIIIQK
ncbi:MAG: T9SS type A sorting domain-containing protein [Bacteroidetes bacterium]|nr:MAG: T9SS type A sorting domain-containing protein [Bacteroidota bacterium]